MAAMTRRVGFGLVVVLFTLGAACGPSEVDVEGSSSLSTVTTSTAEQPAASTTAAPGADVRTIEVAYEGGAVAGGPRRETVGVGEEVKIVVTSDRKEEVHVHTYDLTAEVAPGAPAEITFTASIPGVHEVELEGAHKVLFILEVR